MAKAEIDENAINKIAKASNDKEDSDENSGKGIHKCIDVRVINASFSWTPDSEGTNMSFPWYMNIIQLKIVLTNSKGPKKYFVIDSFL